MVVCKRLLIGLFFAYLFSGTVAVYADKIYLKDGSIQESDRVWLSKAHVHFILKGTSGVEIRYSKEIVARVTINGIDEPVLPKTTDNESIQPSPDTGPKAKIDGKAPSISSGADIDGPDPSMKIDPEIVREHKGLSFYDPRRKRRYWATNDSKHSSLNQVLSALAKMYGRSVSWVESNMGNENDLGAIHHNLISAHEKLAGPPTPNKPSPSVPNEVDLKKIRPQHGPAKPGIEIKKKDSTAVLAHIPNGLVFYDPRRKKKYWTGKERRYNSLEEAMGALAKQYEVTIEWVEQHMGNTNDLVEIHQNLQNSLKQE